MDTKYLDAQTTDRAKRSAVGVYEQSGLSQYTNPNSEKSNQGNATSVDRSLLYTNGTAFPANWDPRYTLFSGFMANPDHRENYQVHKGGARTPATNVTGRPSNDYYVNYKVSFVSYVA